MKRRPRDSGIEIMDAVFKAAQGDIIATGYQRVVIGAKGAYIEFNKDDFVCKLITKPGQEYRGKGKYKYVKYLYLVPADNQNIKIYHQQRTVDYADYKVGMFYIAPGDLVFNCDLYAEVSNAPGVNLPTTYP